MKYLQRIALLSLTICYLSGCSTAPGPSSAYPGESATHIFEKGETAMRDHSYQQAVKRFEALNAQYPFSANSEKAQLYLIYAYYKNDDYTLSADASDLFVQLYPESDHVDYAYYMRGEANYFQKMGVFERAFSVDLATRDLTQIKKSYDDFSKVVHDFPNSRYAASAHQYMLHLRNILAAHEVTVAQYYFDRQAYVAAANRASLVVRHYEGSPSIPAALRMMLASYRALHLTQNVEDVEAVLRFNHYPL